MPPATWTRGWSLSKLWLMSHESGKKWICILIHFLKESFPSVYLAKTLSNSICSVMLSLEGVFQRQKGLVFSFAIYCVRRQSIPNGTEFTVIPMEVSPISEILWTPDWVRLATKEHSLPCTCDGRAVFGRTCYQAPGESFRVSLHCNSFPQRRPGCLLNNSPW